MVSSYVALFYLTGFQNAFTLLLHISTQTHTTIANVPYLSHISQVSYILPKDTMTCDRRSPGIEPSVLQLVDNLFTSSTTAT